MFEIENWISIVAFHWVCLIVIVVNEEFVIHVHVITEIEWQIFRFLDDHVEVNALPDQFFWTFRQDILVWLALSVLTTRRYSELQTPALSSPKADNRQLGLIFNQI